MSNYFSSTDYTTTCTAYVAPETCNKSSKPNKYSVELAKLNQDSNSTTTKLNHEYRIALLENDKQLNERNYQDFRRDKKFSTLVEGLQDRLEKDYTTKSKEEKIKLLADFHDLPITKRLFEIEKELRALCVTLDTAPFWKNTKSIEARRQDLKVEREQLIVQLVVGDYDYIYYGTDMERIKNHYLSQNSKIIYPSYVYVKGYLQTIPNWEELSFEELFTIINPN